MSRPRDFDEAAVLDAAVDRFWAHGYAATSVRDLGEAMGLGPASLYNAFEDKGTLFAKCLERYLQTNMSTRIQRLKTSFGPRQALEGFLAQTVAESLADPRGCMLVNTALEIGLHEDEVRDIVAEKLEELEAFFRDCITAGQKDGTITSREPPGALAQLMLTTILGIRVLARSRPDARLLNGAAEQALAALGPLQN